ncbi:ATP-binding protein [archaeon]|jgi:uncharacterized protein|nr:ATP-binding protein [archaeon]
MKDELKKIIKEFHERDLFETFEREIEIPFDSKKIITIIGPRRSGKTFLLHNLIKSIKDRTNVIYINFEDERINLGMKDLDLIFQAYFELYPEKKEKDLFLFFDELQEVPGWEKFVRRVYDTITQKIFLTGSSAKLLSKEIATSLRGRTISYELYPLSFREYLEFRGIEVEQNTTKGLAKIKKEFNDYLFNGAFPELVNFRDELRRKSLNDYLDVMIYRDLIERYNLSNSSSLNEFVKKLLVNPAQEISINKIYNSFRSQGIKLSKDMIYQYVGYLEDAFIIFPLKNYSESLVKQNIKKFYPVDTGLSTNNFVTLNEEYGKLLEVVCYLEFKRKGKEIYYFNDGSECDFILKDKNKIVSAIQISKSLKENKTREREVNGLLNAMKRFNLKKGYIISKDEKDSFSIEGKKIFVVPVWKFLLEGNLK